MMPYRIFQVDQGGGIRSPAHVDPLEDDCSAFLMASGLTTVDFGAEVWQGARMVCRLPPRAHLKIVGPPDQAG